MRITDILRSIDLFARLSADDLDHLARRIHERAVGADEVVCRQAEPADAMFILTSGRIELSTSATNARERSARQLSEGDCFGEIALLSGEQYAETARTVTDCRLLVLAKDDFEALVASRPQLMRNILAAMSRRAAETDRELLAHQSPGTPPPASGHVYAVFSPRAGAGKTTVAVNIALRLAEFMPGRVALVDLDLVFDDAALLLDLSPNRSLGGIPEQDLQHLDARTLSTCLLEHPSGLRVLVGATRPEDGERVTGSHVRAALTALKRQFLVTIVDCDSNFGEPVLVACEAASRVIVLCTPELSTLRDVRDCERVFAQALQLDRKRLSYVFNHPLPVSGLTRQQFESALERPIAFEVPHAGDAAARAAATAGSVVRPTGRSPFAHTIERLVRDLRPPEADSAPGLEPVAPLGPSRANLLTRVLGRRRFVHG